MTETSAPSSPAYPSSQPSYGLGPSDRGGRPVEVKERPFVIGLLLTIVTLGIYPLFWHFFTHDELHRQMGRENKDKGIWYGYVAVTVIPLLILIFLAAQFIALLIAAETVEPSDEEVLGFLMGFLVWIVLLLILGIVAIVLYVVYVARQWELLKAAKERMGLQLRASAGAFFGLYFGGLAIQVLTSIPATIVTYPIAYYFLQENYNDIPRALQAGQVDAPDYAPGGQGWERGPTRAPTGGPAPVAFGFTHGGAAPGHPAPPPQQSTYGGMQSSSWDAPGRYGGAPAQPSQRAEPGGGFSIRERPSEPPEPPERSYAPETSVEQSFQCPKCHAHVTARGRSGETVAVHCARCGESGSVRLPEA